MTSLLPVDVYEPIPRLFYGRRIPPIPRHVAERFLARVAFGDDMDCWPCSMQSVSIPPCSVPFSPQRVALWLFRGQQFYTGTTVVHHLCQNKRCVNPKHLQPLQREDHQRIHHRLKTEGL